LAEAVYIP